jgi:hypothetical protein
VAKVTQKASQDVRDARAFWLAWGVCTVAAVAPIWAFRFLPMQDYPQHLFYSFVLATWSSPDLDWATHFDAALVAGPDSLFYAVTSWLVPWLGPESAGRAAVTLYVLALSSYVAVEAGERREPPWALLLVIPLAFTQPYYMGFTNYFLTLPALLFALRGQSQLLEGRSGRAGPWVAQVVCGLLLFFAHLSMIFIYVGLAFARVARRLPGARPWAAATAPAATGSLLVMWLWLAPHTRELQELGTWVVRWWPVVDRLAYLGLPITGMRINGGVRLGSVLAWLLIGIAICASFQRGGTCGKSEPSENAQDSDPVIGGAAGGRLERVSARDLDQRIDLAVSILAYFTLPFWLAHYSYVNLRLAPVVYLLAAIVLAQVTIRARWRPVLVAGILGLCLTTWTIHRASDAETAELVPLLEMMAPNRAIYAFYPDAASRTLDHHYFYEHHAHEHTYYHVLRGGGVSSTLFPTAFIPIKYRDPAQIPFTGRRERFRPSEAARFYTYVLVRGGSVALADRAFQPFYRRSGASGAWKLYERVGVEAAP